MIRSFSEDVIDNNCKELNNVDNMVEDTSEQLGEARQKDLREAQSPVGRYRRLISWLRGKPDRELETSPKYLTSTQRKIIAEEQKRKDDTSRAEQDGGLQRLRTADSGEIYTAISTKAGSRVPVLLDGDYDSKEGLILTNNGRVYSDGRVEKIPGFAELTLNARGVIAVQPIVSKDIPNKVIGPIVSSAAGEDRPIVYNLNYDPGRHAFVVGGRVYDLSDSKVSKRLGDIKPDEEGATQKVINTILDASIKSKVEPNDSTTS